MGPGLLIAVAFLLVESRALDAQAVVVEHSLASSASAAWDLPAPGIDPVPA